MVCGFSEVAVPTPFTPVSFSCPLDPEAVPDSDEQGFFSPLDTGVNRPHSKS